MKTVKIDKRKNYKLMVDVETTMAPNNQQIIFDLGFAVFTNDGEVLESHSYVIKEVFENYDLMQKAYYFKKYPLYLEGLETGKFIKVEWEYALVQMFKCIKAYGIKEVSAYNLAFDLRAMIKTNEYLRPTKEFKMFNDMAKNCLWGMSVETICQQKGFKTFCDKHNMITDSKKYYKSSAEAVYAYMNNVPDFEEEHTGLADVLIEIEIYKRVMRQKKKMKKGIWFHPFQMVKIEDLA